MLKKCFDIYLALLESVAFVNFRKLEANGNFTDVYLTDGSKKMICKFLKHFDDLLSAPFIRIHRSFIVNTNFIKNYSKSAGGYITLLDGSEMEVSATYKEQFIKAVGG